MTDKSYDCPDDCRYTESDEWVRLDEDGLALIGITDYAQAELSDVVFVEHPDVGARVEAGQSFGVVESVKAVADLIAPCDGEVERVNGELEDAPERVNEDPYGEAWFVRIRLVDSRDLDNLLTADQYRKYVEEESTG